MIVQDITNIDSKKKKVILDNGYIFPLYSSEIRRFHLIQRSDISDSVLEDIKAVLLSRIKNRILFLLQDCDKSEYQLRDKLTHAFYPEDLVDEAINFLKDLNYIDDMRFARNYIESKLTYSNKSRYEIVNGLLLKGINKNLIDEIICDYEFDEGEGIRKLIIKKGFNLDDLKELDYSTRCKLYQMLLRKGYKNSDIQKELNF